MEEIKNEIKVLTLPSISYKQEIENISIDLKSRLDKLDVNNLVCNEDTVKTIKTLRTQLNSELNDYEQKRKLIKEQIAKPYDEFNEVYTEKIKNQYETAVGLLTKNISIVEKKAIDEKTGEVETYFNENKTEAISFTKFSDIGLKINLSATLPSLKKQVTSFIEKVTNDLDLIETQENNERILIKYMGNYDVSKSIIEVKNDIEKEEAIKKQREEQQEKIRLQNEKMQQEKIKYEKPVFLTEPPVNTPVKQSIDKVEQSKEELLTLRFKATATREKLKKLKTFMEEEGISYE